MSKIFNAVISESTVPGFCGIYLILNTHLGREQYPDLGVNRVLRRTTLFCKKLLNDIFTMDPRWRKVVTVEKICLQGNEGQSKVNNHGLQLSLVHIHKFGNLYDKQDPNFKEY